MINYKISILEELNAVVDKFPDMTMGQIFYEVFRAKNLGGKHILDASDESIYTSVERFLNSVDDEPMSEEEFKTWTNK